MPTEMANLVICRQNICLGGVVTPPAPHCRNGPACMLQGICGLHTTTMEADLSCFTNYYAEVIQIICYKLSYASFFNKLL